MDQIGIVEAESHQFLIGDRTADPTRIADRGSLIALGRGFVAIFTGIAAGPVSLRMRSSDSAPELLQDEWEVIEETALTLRPEYSVMSLDGEVSDDFTLTEIPEGDYRMRVSAAGRDENWDLAVEEASEKYLVEVWPEKIRYKKVYSTKKTDEAWNRTPTGTNTDTAVSAEGDEDLESWGEDATRSLGLTNIFVNGKATLIPRGESPGKVETAFTRSKFANIYEAKKLVKYDEDLVLRICRASSRKQRNIAYWSARRAYELAGLAELDWVQAALENIDADELPEPFDKLMTVHWKIQDDDSIPKTTAIHLQQSVEIVPQYAALNSIFFARERDPLDAALRALDVAVFTGGPEHLEQTLALVREEFFR